MILRSISVIDEVPPAFAGRKGIMSAVMEFIELGCSPWGSAQTTVNFIVRSGATKDVSAFLTIAAKEFLHLKRGQRIRISHNVLVGDWFISDKAVVEAGRDYKVWQFGGVRRKVC